MLSSYFEMLLAVMYGILLRNFFVNKVIVIIQIKMFIKMCN